MTNSNRGTLRHIALLGGLALHGNVQVPDAILSVSPLGGVDVDLTGARFSHDLTITKWSIIGGVSLRVPRDVPVQVDGINLIGGISPVPAPEPSDRDAPTVRVKAYGVIGGVSVTRG